jgi:hypothetical protein
MNKTLLTLAGLSLLAAVAACSSSSTTTPNTDTNAGPTGDGTTGGSTNPQGEAYPSSNLGHNVGTVIPNLKFVGFKAADSKAAVDTTKTATIQLSDYFNPTGKNGNFKLIHLSAASRWCGPCNQETSAMSGYDYQTNQRTGAGIAADLEAKGVVFVQALIDGFTPGKGATVTDLKGWVDDHQSNFTEVLDPGPTAFASFFDGAAVPWNADIDATTMKIMKTELGYDPNLETTINGLLAKIK